MPGKEDPHGLADAAYNRSRLAPDVADAGYMALADLRAALEGVRSDESIRVLDYGCGGSPYRSLFPNANYKRADCVDVPGLDYVIVDEVLAVGDAEFQKKCLGKMKDVAGEGRTILFVSHNMAAVERLCQKAILLRNGTVAVEGPVGEVTHEYLRAARDRSQTLAAGLRGEGIELKDIHFSVDGDDLIFECVAHSQSIKTLGVGVQLDAITGERLAVLRPAKAGLYKSFSGDRCEIRLVLRGLVGVLPEGDYNISLWFSDAGKQAVLSIPDAYQLAVPHKDPLNTGHSFNQLEDGFIILNASLV